MAEPEVKEEGQLEIILKESLEECVGLARKKIRSKKGIAELQNILRDYHQNAELAQIILEVLKLLTAYESAKREEAEEPKDSVSLEQYSALEAVLQKTQGSCRELIRTQQQLKVYCEDLEQKKAELEHSNDELLKSTKQIISGLKRELQRLFEENSKLKQNTRTTPEPKSLASHLYEADQAILRSLSRGRKTIDGQQESITSRESSRGEKSIRLRKNSSNSIRNKH